MKYVIMWAMFFFFQAEDGIRDTSVTGVQTCALPISLVAFSCGNDPDALRSCSSDSPKTCETAARSICPEPSSKIGRASCREKSVDRGGRRGIKKKKEEDRSASGDGRGSVARGDPPRA